MGDLPTNYTVRSHSYLWRADGSSATQGTGSIVNYPTLTSGTATATLSQVTTADVPAIPTASGTLPGSGSFIKVVAFGCTLRVSNIVKDAPVWPDDTMELLIELP